jgi:hypothetical protein
VDPRTDQATLWLRSNYGRTIVLRPIAWERVTSVDSGGATHPVEQFRELASELKQRTPQRFWPELPGLEIVPCVAAPPPCTVLRLEAAAWLSNFDHDPVVDGYTLVLAPLSDHGLLVPVEGTLEATLHGYELSPDRDAEQWLQLLRWAERVSIDCYGPEGAVLRLPMSGAVLDRARSPRQLLRLRLSVPGQGTFEAEVPLLAARPHPG